MIAYILQGTSLGLSAAATPGPFMAYLIAQTLKLGWRRALPAVLAPLLSDGPIVALMLLVLTRFPPAFLRVIQIAGALFVIYLAWKSFQAFRCFEAIEVTGGHETRQNVWQAALMNLLNPNPYIFWSTVSGPLLVQGWQESPSYGIAFLLSFYVIMLGGMAATVILFGTARQLGPKVNRVLLGVSSLALFGFGVYRLAQGVWGA